MTIISNKKSVKINKLYYMIYPFVFVFGFPAHSLITMLNSTNVNLVSHTSFINKILP